MQMTRFSRCDFGIDNSNWAFAVSINDLFCTCERLGGKTCVGCELC